MDNRQEIVTIARARKVLGKKAERMTDKQINDLLIMLRFLCNESIDSITNNEN